MRINPEATKKYTFFDWLRQSFLWCSFLFFVVFTIRGMYIAIIGIVFLVGWFLVNRIHALFWSVDPKSRVWIDRIKFIQELIREGFHGNISAILQGEQEARKLREDIENIDSDEEIGFGCSFGIHWSLVLTIITSTAAATLIVIFWK